jgi:hypothetical protein
MTQRRSIIGSALGTAFVSGLTLLTVFGLLAESDSVAGVLINGLLQTVIVASAFAVLVGVINLLIFVHLRRLLEGKNALNSFALLLSAIVVIAVYTADQSDFWGGELEGEQLSPYLFEVTQVTLESSLAGLVLFALVYGAYRLLHRRFNWGYLLFIAAMLIALVGWLPLDGFEALADVRDWLLETPVTAGTRGLLIGIALGTVTIGIRLILGQERFYQRRQ